jgi:hypothetical protein
VYSENQTKPINTCCGQKADGGTAVSTMFKMFKLTQEKMNFEDKLRMELAEILCPTSRVCSCSVELSESAMTETVKTKHI